MYCPLLAYWALIDCLQAAKEDPKAVKEDASASATKATVAAEGGAKVAAKTVKDDRKIVNMPINRQSIGNVIAL